MNLKFIDIPGYDQWKTCELIDKGWSGDKKYVIETKASKRLLLRISNGSEYLRKAEEYDILLRLVKLNLPISKPIDFGYFLGNTQVFTLMTWMPGDDAEVNLPKFTSEE